MSLLVRELLPCHATRARYSEEESNLDHHRIRVAPAHRPVSELDGGGTGTRTLDALGKGQPLLPLSYTPMVGLTRLERAVSRPPAVRFTY